MHRNKGSVFTTVLCCVALAAGATFAWRAVSASGRGDDQSVSARLGGFDGILAFLHTRAVPALLADPQIAPFFAHPSVSADDIEECLARLLDHDLGGPSQHNGAVTRSGHACRSSMSNIHRGLQIPDGIVTRFLDIVRTEALGAGVAAADVDVIIDRLDRYRGGTRNK